MKGLQRDPMHGNYRQFDQKAGFARCRSHHRARETLQ
jgi:hypothetical protein